MRIFYGQRKGAASVPDVPINNFDAVKLELPDVSDVKGYLFEGEEKLLFELAYLADGDVIEIGTFHGKSTIILASASRSVSTIDPHITPALNYILWYLTPMRLYNILHEGFREHRRKIIQQNLIRHGVWNKVGVYCGMSYEYDGNFPNDRYAMVFVDGGHTYPEAKMDLALYYSKLKKGGLMVVHDYNDGFPGILRAVKEEMTSDKYSSVRKYDVGSGIMVGVKK